MPEKIVMGDGLDYQIVNLTRGIFRAKKDKDGKVFEDLQTENVVAHFSYEGIQIYESGDLMQKKRAVSVG